jgi:hypothetical protein
MARKPRPVIDAVVNRIRAKRPVVAAVIDGMRNAAADPGTSIQPQQVEARSAEHIAEAVAPLIVNANNDEPVNASRVVTGSTYAVLGGLGMLFTQLGPMLEALESGLNSGSKWASLLGFLFGGGAFGGGVLSLFGRLRKGLPPMERHALKPWTWFAPRPTPST